MSKHFKHKAVSGLSAAVLLITAGVSLAQQNPFREPTVYLVEQGPWTGPVLADGQPNVEGHWSNTVGNHNNLTDPQGRHPLDGVHDRPRETRAPSRVIDPPDGQFPFQEWARQAQLEYQNNLYSATREEYVEPLARCAPGGPTKSLMWHGYEIRQYPGYVVFLFDSGTRVIHLDDKPAAHETIKLWNGDSRGYWEGNTLHVKVNNHNGKSRFGRTGEFVSEHALINERYIFDSNGERYLYEVDYQDDTVLTRPMTLNVPAKRITPDTPMDGWNNITFPVNFVDGGRPADIEAYERTCAEHNLLHGVISQE